MVPCAIATPEPVLCLLFWEDDPETGEDAPEPVDFAIAVRGKREII